MRGVADQHKPSAELEADVKAGLYVRYTDAQPCDRTRPSHRV